MPSATHAASGGAKSKLSSRSYQTPIDLELDLAAQQSKLYVLQEEIARLKEIKTRLLDCRERGERELPPWLQEQEQFQQMLAKVQSDVDAHSREEKRLEKMLRRTGRDIHRLRMTRTASKGQLDAHAFKEKMAFVTNLKNDVPVLPETDEAAAAKAGEGAVAAVVTEAVAENSEDEEDTGSECSTLKHDSILSLPYRSRAVATPPKAGKPSGGGVAVKVSLSSETVDTVTEEGEEEKGKAASREGGEDESGAKRYTYEIDPDIGVIV